MSARAALRITNASKHDAVDAAFGRFDLADRRSYGAFLTAHACALPGVERALAQVTALPAFVARASLLEQDLAALGMAMPSALPFAVPASLARAYGALYVIEGSRLGGAMLARQVPSTLPHAYLSATHDAGGWRSFGKRLDAAAEAGGETWVEEAIEAAEAVFDLYAKAARTD